MLLRRQKGSYPECQRLSGPGGREFAWIDRADGRFLVQLDFLTGSREQPRTDLHGHIYRWSGHGLQETATFPTSGATGVTAVPVAGGTLVAVSESLSPEIRFRTDTHVYRMPEPGGDHS